MEKTKVLLDTDIGTDIDDAVCLAYLLENPNCDLLGITTATGEVEKRAMLASSICVQAGKEVPIYPGAERPLLIEQQQKLAAQARALKNWKHETRFPRGEAIEFLRKTIRQHPGEIVLLTIGPLTNIGLLFAVDPEIPGMLKGLVMMCGHFLYENPKLNSVEWNAMGDYHASAIVYRAPVRMHRSVGLDVTMKVNMSAEEFRQAFQFKLFEPIQDYAEIWFENWHGTTFHDPLAAATIFDDQICQFQRGVVDIELSDKDRLGKTIWKPESDEPTHEIAVDVDAKRFFEHFISVF